jgi:Ethanolamine utilization protein EutJ (predicted chaperonin)
MADPPLPAAAAAAAAHGDPPAAFVPEAANNAVADMGHPQVDHGGGVMIAEAVVEELPLLEEEAVGEELLQLEEAGVVEVGGPAQKVPNFQM